MKPEHEKKVAAIEAKLAEIDRQMAELCGEREAVLASDEKYASYVEHFWAFYDGNPLSIRQYYEYSEELDNISRQLDKADDEEFNRLWRKHIARIRYLERWLAV